MKGWIKVVFAAELPDCSCCDEPFCKKHGKHYAECPCVGPSEEGYEHKEVNGVLWARPTDAEGKTG